MKEILLLPKYRKLLLTVLFYSILFSIIITLVYLVTGYIGASKPLSFIPVLKNDNSAIQDSDNNIVLKNAKYYLLVGENGEVRVHTKEGETIISDITVLFIL